MAAPSEVRQPLTRDRILRAALDLADEHGIESLSMRRLGRELGFEAMSLYNHVDGKDDVLDGILDLAMAGSEPPSPAGAWAASIRASAISVHEALRKHPWAGALLMSPARLRPARLRYMESLLRRLREAGFPSETTYHVYHVLDAHIFGFSLWHASHTYTPAEVSHLAETFARLTNADDYPYLYEHGEQHVTEGPHRAVSAFEFGLDLILEGLVRIHNPESLA